ncbi:amino acid permease [Lactococcus termiticola]|uniref:Amino acid permease n=1 Tax=Lactococcus termiticola TaxID=2169526 RepID=A0A2R5HJS8_9LACT|nr:amino acid permease [Lactococcus termiticola]GBG96920.1 amino acid permease [Lactococcus termiticola]
MENEERNRKLSGALKSRHIVMLSLGGAIGSGLFLGSASAIVAAGPAVLLSYLLAGLALYVVMYGVGRMVVHGDSQSREAGMSGIIKPYVGGRWAHFTDWVYWATWMAVLIAEEAGVSTFLAMLFPGVPLWVYALIVAVLGTAINLYSVKAFGETEYWLAFVKIFVIILLIVVGLVLLATNVFHMGLGPSLGHMTQETRFIPHGIGGILSSLLIVIFSFGGSELAAVTVAETENPRETIPKAIRGILFRIISFYVVPIFLFLELLPWKQVSEGTASPFALIFEKIGIPYADKIILVVIIVAIFSAVNSAIYATSRSLYSRVQHAENGLGKSLGKLSKKQVPTRAIMVSAAVLFLGVILSAIFGDGFWQFVAGSISFTITIVWIMLLIASLMMYFKRKETANGFLRMVTVLVLIALVVVLVSQVLMNPWSLSVFALLICLLSFFSYRQTK